MISKKRYKNHIKLPQPSYLNDNIINIFRHNNHLWLLTSQNLATIIIALVKDIIRMNNLRYIIQLNIWYCEKMSYLAKIHHFWGLLQTEITYYNFVWILVVCIDIRNIYLYINMEMTENGHFNGNYRFRQYPSSIIYQQELEYCSYIISKHTLSQPHHYF